VVGATLANGGVNPITRERVFSPETIRSCFSVMTSCGCYDYSGEFAYHVGLPAKSSVSGCIMLVVPNVMSICIYSPSLGVFGNSERGVKFCQSFARKFPFHIFDERLILTPSDPHGYDVMASPSRPKKSEENEVFFFTALLLLLSSHFYFQSPHTRNFKYMKATADNLRFAAARGDVVRLKQLLACGFPVNDGDYDQRGCLHIAATHNRKEIVKILLEQGADYEKEDRYGNTALDDAIQYGHKEIIDLINTHKALKDFEEIRHVKSTLFSVLLHDKKQTVTR